MKRRATGGPAGSQSGPDPAPRAAGCSHRGLTDARNRFNPNLPRNRLQPPCAVSYTPLGNLLRKGGQDLYDICKAHRNRTHRGGGSRTQRLRQQAEHDGLDQHRIDNGLLEVGFRACSRSPRSFRRRRGAFTSRRFFLVAQCPDSRAGCWAPGNARAVLEPSKSQPVDQPAPLAEPAEPRNTRTRLRTNPGHAGCR